MRVPGIKGMPQEWCNLQTPQVHPYPMIFEYFTYFWGKGG
jgi:hypothetical protein